MSKIRYDMIVIDDCINRLGKVEQISKEALLTINEGRNSFETLYSSQICDVQASVLETYSLDLSIIKTNIADLSDNLRFARMKINENEQR